MTDHPRRHDPPEFDPFVHRLCRDIRNDLSKHLLAAIAAKDLQVLAPVAARYRKRELTPSMQRYLDDRMARYGTVIAQLTAKAIPLDDPYDVAVLLWNQELFFEVHEWLEGKWMQAEGTERVVLQALIRAAGTWVHLEHGRFEGARKMAAKAAESLTAHQDSVPPVFDVEVLVAKLAALDPLPPKLGKHG